MFCRIDAQPMHVESPRPAPSRPPGLRGSSFPPACSQAAAVPFSLTIRTVVDRGTRGPSAAEAAMRRRMCCVDLGLQLFGLCHVRCPLFITRDWMRSEDGMIKHTTTTTVPPRLALLAYISDRFNHVSIQFLFIRNITRMRSNVRSKSCVRISLLHCIAGGTSCACGIAIK